MANQKVSALVDKATPVGSDTIYIVENGDTSKKATLANVFAALGGGGTVRDWDMSTDVVTNPVELAADADPYIPPDAGQTIGTTTLTLPVDTTSRFGVASIVESFNSSTAKWILFRVNSATGDLLAGQNFYSLLYGDPVGDPANAGGPSYRPDLDQLYNQFTASAIDAAFTVGDWALMIFDPTVPEVRVKTAAANVQLSTIDVNGAPINLLIQGQTNSGVGSVQMEISTNPADLGALDPGAATPLGDVSVVLPGDAVVGDFLNVTVGGTYEGTPYSAGDGAVYLDDAPADVVNKIPNASKVALTSKVFAVPSVYANMNAALDAAKEFIYPPGTKATIVIDAATTLTSADVLTIRDVDYSWLDIFFNNDTQWDMTGVSGASACITIANASIGSIYGTVTAINQISLRPIYAISARINGLGTLASGLTLNNFYSAGYLDNCSGGIISVDETIDAAASFPLLNLSYLSFPVSHRWQTNCIQIQMYGGANVVQPKGTNFQGGTSFTITAGRGDNLVWYDSDLAAMEFTVNFGENTGSLSVPKGTANLDIRKLTGSGTGHPTIRNGQVRAGWEAFISVNTDTTYKPASTNDYFFRLGKGAKLVIDSSFNTLNIDTSVVTSDVLFALGRGAVVVHEAAQEFTKGTDYGVAIADLDFVDGGGGCYLEKNFLTKDGCAVYVDEGIDDAVERNEIDVNASRALDYADLGRFIAVAAVANVDLTINTSLSESPVDYFWVTNAGTGQANLVAGAGVSIESASGNFKVAVDGMVFVKRIGNNRWVASGDLIA